MTDSVLSLKNVDCHIANEPVLSDISFHLPPGCIAGLIGPSGCGKTTLLRTIAGFEPLAAGTITLDDQLIASATVNLAPEQRQLGMVFQDYALFPHLTVIENVAFGLNKLSREDKRQKAQHYVDIVGLSRYADRYPDELSGGQQQRVALARAIAPHPRLLLLDEPFSNLDINLRRRLNKEVNAILKQERITAILVTHDQEEAFALCDQVGVMQAGVLQQWDHPFNLYHEPKNRFVANFVGLGHFIPGVALDHERVETELGCLTGNRSYRWEKGAPVDVLLRPDDIVPGQIDDISATIINKTFLGAATLYTLKLRTGSVVESLFPSHADHAIGDQVPITVSADHLVAFTRTGEL